MDDPELVSECVVVAAVKPLCDLRRLVEICSFNCDIYQVLCLCSVEQLSQDNYEVGNSLAACPSGLKSPTLCALLFASLTFRLDTFWPIPCSNAQYFLDLQVLPTCGVDNILNHTQSFDLATGKVAVLNRGWFSGRNFYYE